MINGTFGTLGIISKLKFKLIEAKPFVKITNDKYSSIEDFKSAIWKHYKDRDFDFMDGLIYSSSEYVLCMGIFIDSAPYVHNYDWMRIYYEMAKTDKETYLKSVDYFFRYDKGTTHVDVKSPLGRFLVGKFLGSTNILRGITLFRKLLPSRVIPVIVDVFIPFSKLGDFLEWHESETHYFPLWCVPYNLIRHYEWISGGFIGALKEELLIDIAVYSMKTENKERYYRKLEEQLMKLGGLKTLISDNYYTEAEFWGIWNKENYDAVKRITDPDNIFRSLYDKTVRAARGLD
jgi:FAD/FMN-containing dehydrogenase